MSEGLPVWPQTFWSLRFSHLAQWLKSGDMAIEGSEEYADYRQQLLTWEDCQQMLEEFCIEIGLSRKSNWFCS